MRRFFIVVAALFVVLGAGAGVLYLILQNSGPDIEDYLHLTQPKLSEMDAQKMIVISVQGDPDSVASTVVSDLFELFYQMPNTSKGFVPPSIRARWDIDSTKNRDYWISYWALPVAQEEILLPEMELSSGLSASLETWEYGQVAEILHLGPYSEEQPAIHKLHAFIESTEHKITSLHEEEYLIGPGMFGRGNSEEYATIIRYVVEPIYTE
jgi:hypothetical protein